MTRPLKVWGITLTCYDVEGVNRQHRVIVAAPSQKAACAALDCSVGHMRDYGSTTGNATEIAVATARPGVPFILTGDSSRPAIAERYHPGRLERFTLTAVPA